MCAASIALHQEEGREGGDKGRGSSPDKRGKSAGGAGIAFAATAVPALVVPSSPHASVNRRIVPSPSVHDRVTSVNERKEGLCCGI